MPVCAGLPPDMIGGGLNRRPRRAVIDGILTLARWPPGAASMCGDGWILGFDRRAVKSDFDFSFSNLRHHGEKN
ncbi:MAG: hypothetical protein QM674_21870 [Burkholderiaceae bacterium]